MNIHIELRASSKLRSRAVGEDGSALPRQVGAALNPRNPERKWTDRPPRARTRRREKGAAKHWAAAMAALSPEQIAEFNAHGYVIVRGAFSSSRVQLLKAAISSLCQRAAALPDDASPVSR